MAGVLGRKEALTIKEKHSQGLDWAQVAGTAGSAELGLQGSQGWTQLLHHPQIPCDDPGGELAHLVRPPSPLPSAFSRCPQDDRPCHLRHPTYLSGSCVPKRQRAGCSPVQRRGTPCWCLRSGQPLGMGDFQLYSPGPIRSGSKMSAISRKKRPGREGRSESVSVWSSPWGRKL